MAFGSKGRVWARGLENEDPGGAVRLGEAQESSAWLGTGQGLKAASVLSLTARIYRKEKSTGNN